MATAANLVTGLQDFAPVLAANDGAYRPGHDEPFMNNRQQEYFRAKLHDMKDSILREAKGTLSQLQLDSLREADLNDRASSETDWSIELRTRDRQRKLISKIDAAQRRGVEAGGGQRQHRRRRIRLLRGDRRADQPRPPRSPPDRDHDRGSAGAP